MTIKILHNPNCSKSRETLALLEERGITPEIELYLTTKYDLPTLQALAQKLELNDVREMLRRGDELYRTLQLDNPQLTQAELLQAVVENQRLLERPIVINGNKAKIGRPPESVLEIL